MIEHAKSFSDWRIYCDWGSTRLRAWQIAEGKVVDRLMGPGIVGLDRSPAAALYETIAPWLRKGKPRRVILAGMAGARAALHEAPYVACPTTAKRWQGAVAHLTIDGIPARVAAGCADGDDDVMRGEETQIFGAMALSPELAEGMHVVLLPGTHSKWVRLENGAITAFRTVPTGELYALLRSSSLLGRPSPEEVDQDDYGFFAGMDRAASSPGILGKLFAARVGQLRQGRSPAWAASYLSGLLIAGEIAEMRHTFALSAQVAIIAAPGLAKRYAVALARHGISAKTLDGEACGLAGLRMLDDDD